MHKLLKLDEASSLLNISIPTLRRMVSLKKVPTVRFCGRIHFRLEDLEEWIRGHSLKPNHSGPDTVSRNSED